MKVLKAFIKPQRKVKVKTYVNSYWWTEIGTLRFKLFFIGCCLVEANFNLILITIKYSSNLSS